MADDVIRVEVLGTPRILKNGVETSFSRKRVRALLFYLATELKPVPRTTLAWLFWPDKSPQVASRNLSIHLSYLKNALSEDAVISSQGTIALAEDIESDARDYFAFANNPNRNGDHNPLGLFRGPFLDGFSIKDADPFDQWVSSEAQQWRNRSIDAVLERSFDLEIQKRYTDALATIERAISENEIREDLYRRAMSIMEKAGMRAQVGELYRELTTRLNDELGLPPSIQTVECYQSIIGSNDSFTAHVKKSGQRALKEKDMPFIDRQEHVDRALAAPNGSFVLVTGETGIGKTRFLKELPRQTDERRIVVKFTQQTREIPFGGLIDSIKGLTTTSDWPKIALRAQRIMGDEQWGRLRCLIPSIDINVERPASTFGLSTSQIQETIENFFRVLGADCHLLFMCDDIHYADAASLKVLSRAINDQTFLSARFIATFNPIIPAPRTMALFNELQRKGILLRIELTKIGDERMMDILLFFFPDIDEQTARKLITLADGNPFLMKTIIQGLDSGYTEFSGKASLQNLFEYAFKSLTTDAAFIATLLAVHNAPCDAELFSALCENGTGEALFDELSSTGIAARDGSGRIVLLNKRMQEFLVSRLARDSRRLESAHFRLAQTMDALYGHASSNMQDIAICRHYSLSTQPQKCGPYAAKAGDYLLQIDEIEAAIKYYKLAVKHLKGPEKLDASLILYINMTHLGKTYEADLYLQSAISIAQAMGRDDYALTFEAARKLNGVPENEEVRAGVIPCYKKALDPEIRASLLKAEQLATCNGASPLLISYILGFLSSWYMIVGDFDASIECLNRIVGLGLCQNPTTNTSTGLSLFFSALVTLISLMKEGPDPRIFDLVKLAEESFEETPIRSFSSSSEGIKSMLAYIMGNKEEGDRMTEKAIALLETGHNEPMHAATLTTKGMLQHKSNPAQAYLANHEAYRIAKRIGANYSLVRSLIGLVVTSPTKQEAVTYLSELRELAGSIGDASLYDRIAHCSTAVNAKAE